ncbi:MAG: AsmA family protein [Proteobacteria bacterium]|nr:AsmA family protein [Pseudomonadota bacterium]
MAKLLKWIGIVVAALIIVVIALLLIIPRFVDINDYKPRIESMVTESTGRPFSIGGEIDLTLFPWAGVSLSDLHLGNAKGFKEKDFVSVEHFEVRVRLLPLISRDFQVKRFILKGPRIALEKSKAGRGNWEDLTAPKEPKKAEKKPAPERESPLPISGFTVGEFAITSGELIWIDHQKGTEQRLKDINLILDSISPDRPIGIELSANLDGQPMEIRGEVGPLGKPIGEGKVPVLVNVKALDTLAAKLQGSLADLTREPQFNMEMEVQPFSPRKLAQTIGVDLSKKTTDPDALTKMSLKTKVLGTARAVELRDGFLTLDDSTLTFNLAAKQFEKPVVSFNLDLDRIDLDRYMPPPSEAKEKKAKRVEKKEPAKKPDYTPLRKLVMDGTVRVGRLKARGATVSDVKMTVKAKNGIVRVDPFSMSLYEGALSGNLVLNVQKDTPRFQTAQRLENVQAAPLLKDLGYTDRLEGLTNFKADISAVGTEAEEIKRTLNGSGDFAFTDGAIVGFDIAQMVRNVKAAFGAAEEQKPKTEFSELKGNFTIKNGLVDNPMTYLASPLLRVTAKGKVDLPRESLDYRVEPKFVSTLQGQADTQLRAGLMVPVVISGTFSEPKFRPDLGGLVKEETLKKEASKLLEGTEASKLLEGIVGEKQESEGTAKETPKTTEGVPESKKPEEGLLEQLPGLLPLKKKK